MPLPRVIHVREVSYSDDEKGLLAVTGGVQEAIEGDGPTTVGVYKLVATMRACKVVHVKKHTTVK